MIFEIDFFAVHPLKYYFEKKLCGVILYSMSLLNESTLRFVVKLKVSYWGHKIEKIHFGGARKFLNHFNQYKQVPKPQLRLSLAKVDRSPFPVNCHTPGQSRAELYNLDRY